MSSLKTTCLNLLRNLLTNRAVLWGFLAILIALRMSNACGLSCKQNIVLAVLSRHDMHFRSRYLYHFAHQKCCHILYNEYDLTFSATLMFRHV